MSAPFYGEGRYRCEITEQGLGQTKTGNVQVVIRFRVLEGVNPDGPVRQQYERTAYLTVTENTIPYLLPKLQALGYNRTGIRNIDLSDPDPQDLRGTQGVFFCKHEEDQSGSPREKWDVSSGESKPLDLVKPNAKAIRDLDALFGAAAKSQGGASAAPKKQPSRPVAVTANGIDDSDIPF